MTDNYTLYMDDPGVTLAELDQAAIDALCDCQWSALRWYNIERYTLGETTPPATTPLALASLASDSSTLSLSTQLLSWNVPTGTIAAHDLAISEQRLFALAPVPVCGQCRVLAYETLWEGAVGGGGTQPEVLVLRDYLCVSIPELRPPLAPDAKSGATGGLAQGLLTVAASVRCTNAAGAVSDLVLMASMVIA